LADQDRWLFVANRDTGSISVVDTRALKSIGEVPVGRKLADLAITPDAKHLVAVDEAAGECIVLSRNGPDAKVVRRIPVGFTPVSVCLLGDGGGCSVACLWPRRLALLDLALTKVGPRAEGNSRALRTVDLPFAPRKQLAVPRSARVIVTDSFGGQLAVVDTRSGTMESARSVPGHNIRGLAWSHQARGLLMAHQVLHDLAQSTNDDVHWGNLMTNNVRSLAAKRVLTPAADLLAGSDLRYLGDVGQGAGDPAGLAVSTTGTVVVSLGGTNEVIYGRADEPEWQRVAVGRRPTAVVTSSDGSQAFVANTFGDSVSVLDLKAGKVRVEIPLGRRAERSTAQRGEELFYDARLSHDGWFSCHSCHTDGHTNGRLNDNLSDGSLGTPKRVLSLLGVKDTAPFAWNGAMPDLQTQIRQSVQSTMQGTKPAEETVRRLSAYLRTLTAPPGLDRARSTLDNTAVKRGRRVFERQGCAVCHAPPTYTSPRTYNVGLKDEAGKTAFNPPSLRGVSQAGPYFHDSRARTLADVFRRYRHELKKDLSKPELADLLSFLRSL
jgi:cytochrome c peroxidase